jgi:hypothetical protein
MILPLFFTNKPWSFLIYLLGAVFVFWFALSTKMYQPPVRDFIKDFYDIGKRVRDPYTDTNNWVAGVMFVFIWTVFYSCCLYYYLLAGYKGATIQGISVIKIKLILLVYLGSYLFVGLLMSSFYNHFIHVSEVGFAFIFYVAFSLAALKSILFSLFVSEKLRANEKLNKVDWENLYDEIRQVLIGRLIKK